jgi:hypothetical protein
MTADAISDDEPRKSLWLMTLADLLLLLVGFFVFLQANRTLDAKAIGEGIRGGFGVESALTPMAVDATAIAGFAPGSAVVAVSPDAAMAWAREATRDPRTIITVVGRADGSTTDVDPATGSAAILAADRARAVAARLARAVLPSRLRIETGTGARNVLLHIGFAGSPASKDVLK